MQSRARHTPQATGDATGRQWLTEGIKQSPRPFGYETSIWTLKRLAQFARREGWRDSEVRPATGGRALRPAGINGRRAKQRSTSPEEQ